MPLLSHGALREAINNLAVKSFADHVGRGPTKVRSYVDHDIVLCLLEDTMTKAESSLFNAGHDSTVQGMRSDLQETMRTELVGGVEALTGRKVIAFISGSSLNPDLATELFVLDGDRGHSGQAPEIEQPELPPVEPDLV